MSTSTQSAPTLTVAPASRSFAITASRCAGSVPVTRTRPPVMAPATRKVPASMRSGSTRCSQPPSRSHALDHDACRCRRPRCSRPSRPGSAARSTTSGSRAAFSSTVRPSASVAAIIRFSVPVTVTVSWTMRAPRSRPAVRVDVAALDRDLGAHRLETGDVQVHGSRADRAAAGQRHLAPRRGAPPAGRARGSMRAWSSRDRRAQPPR